MHKPEFKKELFRCFYCLGLTQHKWVNRKENNGEIYSEMGNGRPLSTCKCLVCGGISIWYNKDLIYPSVSTIEPPNEDMPERVKELYNEAKRVYPISKKSSAALLRLALQYLCIELGEEGKNINNDIASLVSKGLSVEVQQMLDILRVTGNNAVHPGQLDLNENSDLVEVMFRYINLIVDKFYTEPRKIKESYEKLPESVRIAIEKRESKKN